MYGELRMLCVFTIWSSSSVCVSSVFFNTNDPVSRQTPVLKTTPRQFRVIASKPRSREYSLLAASLYRSNVSMCRFSPICTARANEKSPSAFTSIPSSSLISFQCRSRNPGLRRAFIIGTTSSKLEIRLFSSPNTCNGFSPFSALISLNIFVICRFQSSTCALIASASNCGNGPFCHSGEDLPNSAQTRHKFAYGSHSRTSEFNSG
mmetsp:Transcript_7029/g.26542  ORF Transcript_7029/g.26542 Transcript_7029/m.26542 type:complete len:206 (+) Transcript_7029:1073-1690(+)